MIYFVREGDALRNGLNVYHPDVRAHSIGFKFRWNKFLWCLRWNKTSGHLYNQTVNLKDYAAFGYKYSVSNHQVQ